MKLPKSFGMVGWCVAALSVCAMLGIGALAVVSPSTSATASEKVKLSLSAPDVSAMVASQDGYSLASQSRGKAPDPKQGAAVEDIWKPAPTPRGGVSWSTLEAAKEVTRLDDEGYILSKPIFTRDIRQLEGKRIKVAGWMMPLDTGTTQKHFVLLAYPPGCPFHFHAAPMQFIEINASTPFRTDEVNSMVVSGVLELTGYDESGVFYKLNDARPA